MTEGNENYKKVRHWGLLFLARSITYGLIIFVLVLTSFTFKHIIEYFSSGDFNLDSIWEAIGYIFPGGSSDEDNNNISLFSHVITVVAAIFVFVSTLWGIGLGTRLQSIFRRQSESTREFENKLRSELKKGIDGLQKGDVKEEYFKQSIKELFERDPPPGSPPADPILRRWEDIKRILDQVDEFGQTCRKLAGLPRELDGDRPSVAALNLALMISLFAGIVGTFVGLMLFIDAPDLISTFADSNTTDAQKAAALEETFRAFQPSFASSLIAYTSYVFVRFCRDRADECFLAAVNDFNAYIQRPLKDQLYKVVGKEVVELDLGSRMKLAEVAKQIDTVRNVLDEVAKNLGGLLQGLGATTDRLDGAVASLTGGFSQFATDLRQATGDWDKASRVFSETAERFRTIANSQLADLKGVLNEIRTTLDANVQALSDNAEGIAQAFQDVRAEIDGSAGSLSGATKQLNGVLDRLDESVRQSDGGRSAIEAAISQIRDQVAVIQEASKKFREEILALPRHVKPIVDQAVRDTGEQVSGISQGLASLSTTIGETNAHLADHASALAGGPDGQDLLTILSRLDRHLAPQRRSPPPGDGQGREG